MQLFELPVPVLPFTHYRIDEKGEPVFVSVTELKAEPENKLTGEVASALVSAQMNGQYIVAIWELSGGKIHFTSQIANMPKTEYEICKQAIDRRLSEHIGPRLSTFGGDEPASLGLITKELGGGDANDVDENVIKGESGGGIGGILGGGGGEDNAAQVDKPLEGRRDNPPTNREREEKR